MVLVPLCFWWLLLAPLARTFLRWACAHGRWHCEGIVVGCHVAERTQSVGVSVGVRSKAGWILPDLAPPKAGLVLSLVL